jgi:type IV pilus assembly protein PilC
MTVFKFQGRALDGQVVTGVRKAKDSDDLESKLAEESIILASYSRLAPDWLSIFQGWLKKGEIPRLTRQFSVLISSGINIAAALESVREQTTDKTLLGIFDNIINRVNAGESIHSAFGEFPAYFDSVYVSLLETGELSGTLDISLERIVSYRERTEKLGKKIRSALAYPALVLLVSMIIILTLVTYIIPIFSSMYAGFGLELPSLTRNVVAVSDYIKEYLWIWPVIIMILIVLMIIGFRSRAIRVWLGGFIGKMPLINHFYIKHGTARFCRTLGVLLSSGLHLIDAISVSGRTIGSPFWDKRLESAPALLSQGKSLAETLESCQIFPKTVIRMTAAGESTGRLGEMISKVADFYESEIDTEISTMTSLIEPIVIIVLGIVIAFILIAMYLPLFDLIGQLGA